MLRVMKIMADVIRFVQSTVPMEYHVPAMKDTHYSQMATVAWVRMYYNM